VPAAATTAGQARELLATLDRDGRAFVPIGAGLDPAERARKLLQALRLVQLARAVRPSLVVSLPTGEELGRPDLFCVVALWLPRGGGWGAQARLMPAFELPIFVRLC
jgi:hypothetical protein